MSCCRSPKSPPPAKTYDSPFCQKCNENLHDLFMAQAVHQTRGQQGDARIRLKLMCPKCNTLNIHVMNVNRTVKR